MSITYNITTNFASKDALPDNDPGKVIRGSDFSAEFTGIQAAFLSAAPALNPTFTGTSTFASVDINGGSVDGTTIGASSKAAGSFTTLTATGLSVLPSVNIDGGAIDGTTVGASVPSTGAFTTLSASSIAGPLTGNVTGNVTGNLTGDVVGNVIGNISAVTGTSSFNNVTINGSLDMVAGTSATVTNLSEPVNASDAATKNYVDTGISNLVASAPATLDTLNELAAALGDDANFATTTANSLATKLPLAGGTMTGTVTFSSGKVTGLPTPTAASDAAPKSYVDDNFLGVNGGALLGTLDMGSNKVTSAYVPVDDNDLTNKLFVEGIAGSASAAAASAAAALTSENNAATSETNASNSATSASSSATSATASATSATNSASAAFTSASNAATSEINAGASETNAAASESAAATSETNAAASESAAATSESNAATSESNASTSASNAATSEANAAASFDSFDDRYLGAKASDPTLDNDGDALITGALYFNTTSGVMKAYNGSAWVQAYEPSTGFVSQVDGDVGAAELPTGTEAQRPTAATGLMRFNTDANSFEGYNGTAWGSIGGGASGGGGDAVFYENDQTVTTDYIIAADKNAMSTGPISINSGVSVTIETGARWVVI